MSVYSTLQKKANKRIMLNFSFKFKPPEDDQRKRKIGLDSWKKKNEHPETVLDVSDTKQGKKGRQQIEFYSEEAFLM